MPDHFSGTAFSSTQPFRSSNKKIWSVPGSNFHCCELCFCDNFPKFRRWQSNEQNFYAYSYTKLSSAQKPAILRFIYDDSYNKWNETGKIGGEMSHLLRTAKSKESKYANMSKSIQIAICIGSNATQTSEMGVRGQNAPLRQYIYRSSRRRPPRDSRGGSTESQPLPTPSSSNSASSDIGSEI